MTNWDGESAGLSKGQLNQPGSESHRSRVALLILLDPASLPDTLGGEIWGGRDRPPTYALVFMSWKKLGLVLFVVSFGPWLGAFAVPFSPLPLAQKAVLAPVLFVIGEGMFWLSVAILGKEAAARYGRWLSPRFWKLKFRQRHRNRSRRP